MNTNYYEDNRLSGVLNVCQFKMNGLSHNICLKIHFIKISRNIFSLNISVSQEYISRCGWSTSVSPLIKIIERIGNTITWMSVPRWGKVGYDF